jgi:choloylglycine hydrolase
MCTSLRIRSSDGTVIVGRTMEYALEVNWELRAVPRGVTQSSSAPDGAGLTWTGTNGYVGMGIGDTTTLGMTLPAQPSVPDGVNEHGLYAGLLYLPSFAAYEDPQGVPGDRLLAPLDMASFVLATCDTVPAAIAAIAATVVWAAPIPVIGVPPLHLILHDRNGDAAVVEWVGGTRQVYDNPIGVATNSPPFDWHLTNLRNYVNQTAMDVPALAINGRTIAPLGQGTGMLGLPGDFTPPSRFVRAVAFSASARTPDTVAAGANAAMHLLSSFDITKGVVRDAAPEGLTGVADDALGDYTCFRSVSELGTSPAYTVLTYDDAVQRRIALADIDLTGGPARTHPVMPQPPVPTVF